MNVDLNDVTSVRDKIVGDIKDLIRCAPNELNNTNLFCASQTAH